MTRARSWQHETGHAAKRDACPAYNASARGSFEATVQHTRPSVGRTAKQVLAETHRSVRGVYEEIGKKRDASAIDKSRICNDLLIALELRRDRALWLLRRRSRRRQSGPHRPAGLPRPALERLSPRDERWTPHFKGRPANLPVRRKDGQIQAFPARFVVIRDAHERPIGAMAIAERGQAPNCPGRLSARVSSPPKRPDTGARQRETGPFELEKDGPVAALGSCDPADALVKTRAIAQDQPHHSDGNSARRRRHDRFRPAPFDVALEPAIERASTTQLCTPMPL